MRIDIFKKNKHSDHFWLLRILEVYGSIKIEYRIRLNPAGGNITIIPKDAFNTWYKEKTNEHSNI